MAFWSDKIWQKQHSGGEQVEEGHSHASWHLHWMHGTCCSVSKAHLALPQLGLYCSCVHSTIPQALHLEISHSATSESGRCIPFFLAFLDLSVQSDLALSPNVLVCEFHQIKNCVLPIHGLLAESCRSMSTESAFNTMD